jgi:hypothetical protein
MDKKHARVHYLMCRAIIGVSLSGVVNYCCTLVFDFMSGGTWP